MQNCPNSGNPGMAIPSQAPAEYFAGEGVETRRVAPKPRNYLGDGEGIVQTANPALALSSAAPGRRKPQTVRKSVEPKGS